MILAAGLGSRMKPLTLKLPKPLIKIRNINLLERSINLLTKNGIKQISVNTHYLSEEIEKFISNLNTPAKITISKEEKMLLDTGGGVKEGTKKFENNPFFIINPDTLWRDKYLDDIRNLEIIYFKKKTPCLLLVNKKISYDQNFKGDFNLNDNIITKNNNNNFIFTGLQIMERKYLEQINKKVFSMNEVWNNLIQEKYLHGLESKIKFYHLNTNEIYNKISNLDIID